MKKGFLTLFYFLKEMKLNFKKHKKFLLFNIRIKIRLNVKVLTK